MPNTVLSPEAEAWSRTALREGRRSWCALAGAAGGSRVQPVEGAAARGAHAGSPLLRRPFLVGLSIIGAAVVTVTKNASEAVSRPAEQAAQRACSVLGR